MRKLFKKGDKDKGSSAPAENPYAAAPKSNYAPSVTSVASAAPSYRTQDPNPSRPMGGQPAPRNNSYGGMPPPQQQRQQPQQQYTSTAYGSSSGYGSNQYGTPAGGHYNSTSRGQGSYGNPHISDQTHDVNRAHLMDGAKPVGSSYGGFQSNPYATNAAPPDPQNPYANPNDMQQQQQPRGRYFDLTQEEDPDDREHKDVANQFLEEKAQTNNTLDRIIQLTAGIEMHSDDISQRIERQEASLDNYERNMDIANAKTRQAKAAVKDLSTADHMFNFRTRGKREREIAEKTERDLAARQVEDETRNARHERQRAFQNAMESQPKPRSTFERNTGKNKLAFDFDDDGFQAENDALDNEFDDKMDVVERSIGVINMRAKGIGFQIEQSNQRLPGLTEKTDSAIGTLQDTNHRLRQKMGQ